MHVKCEQLQKKKEQWKTCSISLILYSVSYHVHRICSNFLLENLRPLYCSYLHWRLVTSICVFCTSLYSLSIPNIFRFVICPLLPILLRVSWGRRLNKTLKYWNLCHTIRRVDIWETAISLRFVWMHGILPWNSWQWIVYYIPTG